MSLLLLFLNSVPTAAAAEATHGHTADSALVTVTTEISPAEALHGHTADATVVVTALIIPNETLHSQTADASSLASTSTVSPNETRHLWVVDAVDVFQAVPADIEIELIRPDVLVRLA